MRRPANSGWGYIPPKFVEVLPAHYVHWSSVLLASQWRFKMGWEDMRLVYLRLVRLLCRLCAQRLNEFLGFISLSPASEDVVVSSALEV